MRKRKQSAIQKSKLRKKISANLEENCESDFFGDIDFYHLMKEDEWEGYDFEKELVGEFDENACLNEVNEREAMSREDALSLEDVRFDIEAPETESVDAKHFYD